MIPAGLDVTVPVPVKETVNDGVFENVAVTGVAALTATVHVRRLPEHPPPDQAMKAYPVPGSAIKVTLVP
jgi:hypothetical protein